MTVVMAMVLVCALGLLVCGMFPIICVRAWHALGPLPGRQRLRLRVAHLRGQTRLTPGGKASVLRAVGVFVLLLTMPTAPETVTVTNATFGTVAGETLSRTFVVRGAGTITNVDILIDFSKCAEPAPGPHDTRCINQDIIFNEQIVFQLMSPSHTVVDLVRATIADRQAIGARVSVTFDDQAAPPVRPLDPNEIALLQSGRFPPVQPLAAFTNQSAEGTWTLILQDMPHTSFHGDPLQYYSATLCINEACPAITSLLIGDVDASDARDAVDATVLLEAVVGVNPPDAIQVSAAGDVNADGTIDNRDAILILALAAGRIPPLPNPNAITAVDTGAVTAPRIVIMGTPGAAPPHSTVTLRNATTNGPPIAVPTDPTGSFGGQQDVRLDGVAGNTIVVDIDGSPARAAILVQTMRGPLGPGLLASPP